MPRRVAHSTGTSSSKEWDSPSGPRSHPYALVVVDGIVWYNELGMRPDTLVRFDPETEQFQNWPIPSGGIYAGIIRHMRPTTDGDLLIHQSGSNRVMHVTASAVEDQAARPVHSPSISVVKVHTIR